MMLAPEHVPHSRTVHVPFQEELTRHLKRRATAHKRRLPLLGIGVADAGNADGTGHNPPAVLAGYRCGEHTECERCRDGEVATWRFRKPQHVGESVNDDRSGSFPSLFLVGETLGNISARAVERRSALIFPLAALTRRI
jgi:hypothetical protein